MNERIEKLVEQARKYANEYVEDEVEMQFHKKFAELIVCECARVANENVGAFTPGCGNSVLEHFGVKE